MAEARRYIHDRLILLLLSINTFLFILGSLLIVLRLDSSNSSYIIEHRTNLGISGNKPGNTLQVLSFVVYMAIVLVINTLLSARVYRIRREYATTILGMGTFLLIMAILVSYLLLYT